VSTGVGNPSLAFAPRPIRDRDNKVRSGSDHSLCPAIRIVNREMKKAWGSPEVNWIVEPPFWDALRHRDDGIKNRKSRVDDALLLIREALDDLGVKAALIEVEGQVGFRDDEAGVEVCVYCHAPKPASPGATRIEDFIRRWTRVPGLVGKWFILCGTVA
jgi:hypothetical protein